MIGIIQDWLLNKVGINCNLNNLEDNILFCDGVLIANILQQYGLLNTNFVQSITATNDTEQCKRNLKLLQPLFKMLKVKYDNDVLYGIASNKASTIVKFLYELFVCLENKHQLYYIPKQNFNSTQANLFKSSRVEKFDVREVVDLVKTTDSLACLQESIVRSKDIIDWYKQRCEKVRNSLEEKLKNVKDKLCYEETLRTNHAKEKCCIGSSDVSMSQMQLPDIDSFLKVESNPELMSYDYFISSIKSKQYHNAIVTSTEKSIRESLITRTWHDIIEKQNDIYNAVFAEIMLKESYYEKQIVTNLINTHNQINILNENQSNYGARMTRDIELIQIDDSQLKDDFKNLETAYKNEQNRVLELHRKLYKEKQEITKRKIESECISILEAIIDLAIYSSDYKKEFDISVPSNVWKDWMQFFFKSEPIYTPFEKIKNDILLGFDINYDEVVEFESEECKALSENDLNEYLYTTGRWFYENICLENEDLNETILVYIVYRLLTLKYPHPPSPLPADIPSFQTTAVLLNINGMDCIEKLRVLLTKPDVHIFDTNTVIKACIDAFKNETKPLDGDLKGSKRKKSKSKQSDGRESNKNAKRNKSKDTGKTKRKKSPKHPIKEITNNDNENNMINVVNKETQTSIPKDDEVLPQRTALGMLGENISTILKNGEELDNPTIVSAIVEYLKTLAGIGGWVILNYPLTIQQAFEFELVLTGKYIDKGYFGEDNDEVPKMNQVDELSEKRKSRLLPTPLNDSNESFKTYFSIFIKAKDETLNSNQQNVHIEGFEPKEQISSDEQYFENDTLEKDLTKEVDALENLYSNQKIFAEFGYSTFDLVTLKRLARMIINEPDVNSLDSIELFGEEILNKIVKVKKGAKRRSSPSTKGGKLKKGKKMSKKSKENTNSTSKEGLQVNTEIKIDRTSDIEEERLASQTIKHPNDADWENISLPIDEEIGKMLATVWENIESSYIKNIDDIFYENRVINSGLVPYTTYVKNEIYKVIQNEDIRQDLIDTLVLYHNNVENDLRHLPEIKSLLHCKVLELQNDLWNISDEKRESSEARRQEIINENWLLLEICMLINNFLSLIQVEFDRSVESIKLINDYYLSMLKRDLATSLNLPQYSVKRMSVNDILTYLAEFKNNSLSSGDSLESQYSGNLVSDVMINCQHDDKCLDYLSSIIDKVIDEISEVINTRAQYFYNLIQKEKEFIYQKNKPLSTNREKSKTKSSPKSVRKKPKSSRSSSNQVNKPSAETNPTIDVFDFLVMEWIFTNDVELKRFSFRMELIKQRSREDILEYFCFVEDVVCELHSVILERYDKDISSINELCKFIKTAIEEETSISPALILDKGKFFVIGNTPSGESQSEYRLYSLAEALDDCYFTIGQLHKLKNIFKIAGPYGVIRKQPFCYILQDLMLFNAADNEPHLPRLWSSLDDVQLRNVIDVIFGPEYAIDWRDFIIYNLEISYPSIEQILSLRGKYLMQDIDNTELVTLECFESTVLWFEEELPSCPQLALRALLTKRLLFEMFQSEYKNINYTALLLYFCKDINPIVGFQKALSLSLGKYVVISEDELQNILKEEAELNQCVTKLVNDLVTSVVDNREGVLIYEVFSDFSYTYYGEEPSVTELSDSVESSISVSKSHSIVTEKQSRSFQSVQDVDYLKLNDATYCTDDVEKHWASKIHVNTTAGVLNACFHHQDKTFNLRNLYLSCLEEEADEDGMFEVYKLVNLSCIQNLFTITNKFKIVSPYSILKNIGSSLRNSQS